MLACVALVIYSRTPARSRTPRYLELKPYVPISLALVFQPNPRYLELFFVSDPLGVRVSGICSCLLHRLFARARSARKPGERKARGSLERARSARASMMQTRETKLICKNLKVYAARVYIHVSTFEYSQTFSSVCIRLCN